jgi:uncharacterized membrane protein YeaQ/YmgE (transglycosylase-associated protein family)
MPIITWVLLGLISGFIASKVVNGGGQGLVMDMVLGVVGALVGGGVFQLVGETDVSGSNLWSVFVSGIGAVALLVAYHVLPERRSHA